MLAFLPRAAPAIALAALLAQPATASDYFKPQRQLIRHGVEAVLACNGLFTSKRTLAQVKRQELAYLVRFDGDTAPGELQVHAKAQAVTVANPEGGQAVSAAFRPGIGCVVMAPEQRLADIDTLPQLLMPPPAGDPATLPWPMGDKVLDAPLPAEISDAALQAASDWAFERDTPEQDTISLLILYRGQIVHERYADGFDRHTRTRTWSTAKSIAATLIGQLVDAGKLSLDEPLALPWAPALEGGTDPRTQITLRHLLHMSSGLYPVDSFGLEYATGSGLAYWAGASSVAGALNRGLVRAPGSFWDYENYDTLLAVLAMKQVLGEAAYREYPRRALLDKLGMRNTLLSTDRFGDFILSSQVYTNARDLARFGQLYLQQGQWQGEQLLSKDWIDFVRRPAPATADSGNFYGGQWWLVPDERKGEVPPDAYSTAGNRGQFVIVVPSHELVIVRRGLDYGAQGFDRWALAREVIKAVRR
ncbi:serine hydrolase domain-containing protein [Parahaliea mediterranea]|uniref:serine hydrolase domain-containing protein n=1 Tax=Parahaliea mediterranea TaxID=651086 RepID=UPI001F4DC574|nr:serine hydrolase [Parahaliea mediterranea]